MGRERLLGWPDDWLGPNARGRRDPASLLGSILRSADRERKGKRPAHPVQTTMTFSWETSRGLWRRRKTRRRFVERVGNAVAESKQDGSGQRRGKRTAPPDGVWRGL
jgi:hypothetical protein